MIFGTGLKLPSISNLLTDIKFRHKLRRAVGKPLLAAALLIAVAVAARVFDRGRAFPKHFAATLTSQIAEADKRFVQFANDDSGVQGIVKGSLPEAAIESAQGPSPYLFLYSEINGFRRLLYWNTQTVLPPESLLSAHNSGGFITLPNGRYVWFKKRTGKLIFIGLEPIQWQYFISTAYLKNDFIADKNASDRVRISETKTEFPVEFRGKPAFWLAPLIKNSAAAGLNFPGVCALLALILIGLCFQRIAESIYAALGLGYATLFLSSVLIVTRVLLYLFPSLLNLRVFDLFDPSVYGADAVQRSLGDLLINALLFFWLISFIRIRLKGKKFSVPDFLKGRGFWFVPVTALILLTVTHIFSGILRSLVADSQISFDVLDFFSLNFYSVVGFVVICCMAIGYYYFNRVLFFLLQNIYPKFGMPLAVTVSVSGLLVLSFRIGSISGGFEIAVLVWLLLFALLLKNDLGGFFRKERIISRMVFWLFFFSATVTAVISHENRNKELRNRQHYAEILAAKTDPITEVLLNTMLTEFRPDLLSTNFERFSTEPAGRAFRDSLVNSNFAGYSNKYATAVLVYDSTELPLYNDEPLDYNSLNSIYVTQARRTSVEGLYLYDAGFDRLNYIAKRTVRNFSGQLQGYVFIIVRPRDEGSQALYPELFGRGAENSIEGSTRYAYAVYEKGKLVDSHNDYAFSTRYPETFFPNNQFLSVNRKNYNELWYNPGGEKFVVIVQENKIFIEAITLFSYLFCAFLLLSLLYAIFSVMNTNRFDWRSVKKLFQFNIKQQVHGTVIFFSALSFIIIGIATIVFFINRYESNNREVLSRTISIMEKELQQTITKEAVRAAIFESRNNASPGELGKVVKNASDIHGTDINLYSLTGDLKASSLPLPYEKGIISTKMDPVAWQELHGGKVIQFFHKEKIGSLEFVSYYIPVTGVNGEEIAYLNIPYFTSQSRLNNEISNFLVTIINLNAFIFLIAGIVALTITNKITGSFTFISERMKKVNLGKMNEKIEWNRNDEIGALVTEYNRMVAKLDESAEALARSERESAWQEMAKQVAHEIKNPLTPMKLSMQFLQKSISSGAPNIEVLAAKVSATLVEQIDHLSNIAGEFSRFANIENAKPEKFDLTDLLRSVQQLYDLDPRADFTWRIPRREIPLFADKTHINRVLTNLILNGVQAVPEDRRATVNISAIVSGNTITIVISDNGSGIDEETKRKIFTPNFTTKSSGTGLGLAMSKRMVEQAGGTIGYETSAAGTSFSIILPLSD